nr:9520_t:CDS:2 [Entrophospora candida]
MNSTTTTDVLGMESATTINVNKLSDARNAGTRYSSNCVLVLTEGDSANAAAISGVDLKEQIKIPILAAYVSEHTEYHHSITSLYSTIIGLAQNFVGSNNINLLEPIGQFGSRKDGGDRCTTAEPDYLDTRLTKFAQLIYPQVDEALLDHLYVGVEPRWYVPIIPMILINGAVGIASGWSTNIPNFSLKDVIQNLKQKINGENMIPMHPWCHGFHGEIEEIV